MVGGVDLGVVNAALSHALAPFQRVHRGFVLKVVRPFFSKACKGFYYHHY